MPRERDIAQRLIAQTLGIELVDHGRAHGLHGRLFLLRFSFDILYDLAPKYIIQYITRFFYLRQQLFRKPTSFYTTYDYSIR